MSPDVDTRAQLLTLDLWLLFLCVACAVGCVIADGWQPRRRTPVGRAMDACLDSPAPQVDPAERAETYVPPTWCSWCRDDPAGCDTCGPRRDRGLIPSITLEVSA